MEKYGKVIEKGGPLSEVNWPGIPTKSLGTSQLAVTKTSPSGTQQRIPTRLLKKVPVGLLHWHVNACCAAWLGVNAAVGCE